MCLKFTINNFTCTNYAIKSVISHNSNNCLEINDIKSLYKPPQIDLPPLLNDYSSNNLRIHIIIIYYVLYSGNVIKQSALYYYNDKVPIDI